VTKKVSRSKKLSLKKETVKDLDAGPGKAKELGEEQLDGVNGGTLAFMPTQTCVRGPGPGRCLTISDATGQVFTVACPTLVCNRVK
jgi:hypothetical protein